MFSWPRLYANLHVMVMEIRQLVEWRMRRDDFQVYTVVSRRDMERRRCGCGALLANIRQKFLFYY